jgi:hypothetical protein
MVDRLGDEAKDIERAGSHGIVPALAGGILGTVVSPTFWTGVGAVSKFAQAPRVAGLIARYGTAGRVTRGAAVGAGEEVLNELAHEAGQELHSARDAFLNLGLGAALGGVAGRYFAADIPGTALHPPRSAEELKNHLLNSSSPPEVFDLAPGVDIGEALARQSVGAAAVAKNKAAPGASLGPLFDKWTPVGRAVNRSAFNEVDFSLHQRLYEVPVGTTNNAAGIATEPSAELLARLMSDVRTIRRAEDVGKVYREMALEVFGEGHVVNATKNLVGAKSNRLTAEEFFVEVTRYRRARAVVEEMGDKADPRAKEIVARPHEDARVEGDHPSGRDRRSILRWLGRSPRETWDAQARGAPEVLFTGCREPSRRADERSGVPRSTARHVQG